jgi:hypothetical protein
LLSEARELYKSTTGALSTNEELELVTSDLHAIVTRFRQHVQVPELGSSAADRQLLKDNFNRSCDAAAKVAEDLLGRLEKLKVKGKHKAWKSFRQAVKTAWTTEEVAALRNRLSDFKAELETHVLLSLRYVGVQKRRMYELRLPQCQTRSSLATPVSAI